jgi:hypothetical protein
MSVAGFPQEIPFRLAAFRRPISDLVTKVMRKGKVGYGLISELSIVRNVSLFLMCSSLTSSFPRYLEIMAETDGIICFLSASSLDIIQVTAHDNFSVMLRLSSISLIHTFHINQVSYLTSSFWGFSTREREVTHTAEGKYSFPPEIFMILNVTRTYLFLLPSFLPSFSLHMASRLIIEMELQTATDNCELVRRRQSRTQASSFCCLSRILK